jgi:hypothetical protein
LSNSHALSNHAQTPLLIPTQKNDFAVHDFAISKNAGADEKKADKKACAQNEF